MTNRRRAPWTLARHLARRGSVEDKFWTRVQKGSDCWIWLGGHNVWGYGVLTASGRTRSAHRISWELHNGSIPDGMQVCHHCDVRDCVRPDHLFLGSQSDNMQDAARKGRCSGWPKGPSLRRGENHYAARLTDVQIAEIRAAVATGERHRVIAERYSITRQYVGMLAHRDRRT